MATNTVNLKATYGDYTERNYKVPFVGYTGEGAMTADQVAAKIHEFNTAAASASSSVQQTFLSENGAPITAITEAVIVTREETQIYHA